MAVITLNDGTELHAADGLSSEQYKDIVDSYYESIGGYTKQQPQQPVQQKQQENKQGFFASAGDALLSQLDKAATGVTAFGKALGEGVGKMVYGDVYGPDELQPYITEAKQKFDIQNQIANEASQHSPVGAFVGNLGGGLVTAPISWMASSSEKALRTGSTASGVADAMLTAATNLAPLNARAISPLTRTAQGAAIGAGGFLAQDLGERAVDKLQGIKDEGMSELGSSDWYKELALQAAVGGVMGGVLGERAPTKREMNKIGQSALDDVLGSIFQERTDAASREALLQEQRQAAIQQEAVRRNLLENGKQPTLANSIDEMLNIAAESDIKKRSKARQKDIESVFNEKIPLHDERGNLSGKSITTGERLLETVPGKDLGDFLKSKELTRAYETDKSLGRVGDNFNEQLNADVPNQVAISKRMLENEALNETTTLGASPAERQVEIAKKIIESPEWTTEGGQSLRNKADLFDQVHQEMRSRPEDFSVDYDTTNLGGVSYRPGPDRVPTLHFDPEIINPSYRPVAGVKNLTLERNTMRLVPMEDKKFAQAVFDSARKDYNGTIKILNEMGNDAEGAMPFLKAITDGTTTKHTADLTKAAAVDAFVKSRLDPQFIEKSLRQTRPASEAAATSSQRNEWNPRVVHTESGTIIKNLTPIEMHQAEAMGAQRVEGSLDYFVPESKATYKQLPDGSFIFCE